MKLIRNSCLIFYLLNSILFANNTEINVTPNITTIGNPIVVTLETKDAIIKIPNDNSLKPFQVLNKTQEKFKISWNTLFFLFIFIRITFGFFYLFIYFGGY